MTFSNATFRISLSACALWLVTGPAHAVDLNSQDLIPAPAGTDAVLGYFSYATRDSFTPTGGGELKRDTGLDSFVSIFRYVHYMDIGGFMVAPQVLLPYGRLYNGSLNGVRLDSASGLGDPIFAAPVWLVNNPDTTFAIVHTCTSPPAPTTPDARLTSVKTAGNSTCRSAACSNWVTVSPLSCPQT